MKAIRLKDLDHRFVDEVADEPGGEGIRACFSCGTCTAGCPIRKVNETYNPRKIIRMVLLGMREEVLKEGFLWLCSTCYTCQERCPQDVRITELMVALKNLAVREGNLPSGLSMQLKLIREHGRLYPLDEFDNKKRARAGLPELPTRVEEVALLLEGLSSSSEPEE